MNRLVSQIWTPSRLPWTSRYQILRLQKTRWDPRWSSASTNDSEMLKIKPVQAAGATSVRWSNPNGLVDQQCQTDGLNTSSLTIYPLLHMLNSTHRKWRQIKMKKQRRRNVSSFLLLFSLFKISTKICKEIPDFSSSAPKCGFIKGNEKIMMLLEKVKPEIVAFRETIITVSHRSGCQNTSTV